MLIDKFPFYSYRFLFYFSSIFPAFPTTGGDENYLIPALEIFFLFRFYLNAIPPPPARLIFPYFLVVFTKRVK